ncbi:MAG: helix-turn-helix domain-containing protein [Clostridiales Family XIII bacterium]|jgi:transcriptional regulator with XRE-family HTH domain|nr:helix-turn-helix domain-containing protein [Clostridiales Family XIII bacterium]
MKRKATPTVEETFAEVGESIRTWRKLYALKTVQVAERAGISLGTLRKIECGDPSVGLGAFLEVLRSLGLLNVFAESLDPMNSDLGRARITENLPKRVRS